jgi:hypothetical protein
MSPEDADRRELYVTALVVVTAQPVALVLDLATPRLTTARPLAAGIGAAGHSDVKVGPTDRPQGRRVNASTAAVGGAGEVNPARDRRRRFCFALQTRPLALHRSLPSLWADPQDPPLGARPRTARGCRAV